MTDLGTFGGVYGWAYGINNSGVVVGFADIAGDQSGSGFVYYGSGAIENLNDLLADPSSGWTIGAAMSVNDSGQIVADAQMPSGASHVVLLTPTPEPSSICLLIIVAVTALAIKSRRPAPWSI